MAGKLRSQMLQLVPVIDDHKLGGLKLEIYFLTTQV